jgi:outer membrane protein OmpA-like peptidoglycan-associated protein
MNARAPLFAGRERESGGHWLSVSDLMAGLMMIFLFISIIYMREVQRFVVEADRTQQQIYEALLEEFKEDLPEWNAEIDRETMTFRFREPEVLFEQGGADLQPRFERILADFFPRYVNVLAEFEKDIEEVRIEGHTSSEWRQETEQRIAYFKNMKLSQDRTRNVLEYCLSRQLIDRESVWINQKIAAVGLSSTKLVLEDGFENKAKSRRVEFRVKTNFEQQIIERIVKERGADAA